MSVETLDIGEDTGTPVNRDYDVPYRFTGNIHRVTIDLKLQDEHSAAGSVVAGRQAEIERLKRE